MIILIFLEKTGRCKDMLGIQNITKKIVAIVVTYNRKYLLVECLEAIFEQTYEVEKIIVINNASTDGTEDLLKEKGYLKNKRIDYVLMEKNVGGAGGFYEGIKRSREMDIDWIWIMDDDTIPKCECLEELLKAEKIIKNEQNSNSKIAFLASTIYGPKGECMNVPDIQLKCAVNGYPYWYKNLSKGMVNISAATFVSLLVNIEAVKKCGLPCKDYFIWGDDTEYTKRLATYYGDAYLIGTSIAVHKRENAKALGIKNENAVSRIKMYHYYYRNNFINAVFYDAKYKVWVLLIRCIKDCLKLRSTKIERYKRNIMCKGYWEGITQYKKFASYIRIQLGEEK